MFHAAGYGFIAAMLVGVVVGFSAAIVNAPSEVAGGIASGLGAVCGMMAFGLTIASRFYRKRSTAQA
jgi:hypothetical protein